MKMKFRVFSALKEDGDEVFILYHLHLLSTCLHGLGDAMLVIVSKSSSLGLHFTYHLVARCS